MRWLALLTATGLLLGCAPAPGPLPGPAPVPAATALPPLLVRLAASGWRLAGLAGTLPAPEARYQTPQAGPDYSEYAHAGGNLRLYAGPDGEAVFALLVNSDDPAFAAFRSLASTADYEVTVAAQYVIVCRTDPLDRTTFTSLRNVRWPSGTDLVKRLGQPSYTDRASGEGTGIYAYLPQGLVFTGGPAVALAGGDQGTAPTYEGYRAALRPRLADFARARAWEQARIADALGKGKPSPGDRYRAAYLDGVDPWGPTIVIGGPGRAEWRVPAGHLIPGLEWLHDHRLVYAVVPPGGETTFYTVDAADGQQRPAARVPGAVTAFGLAAPGRIWYEAGGARQELLLP